MSDSGVRFVLMIRPEKNTVHITDTQPGQGISWPRRKTPGSRRPRGFSGAIHDSVFTRKMTSSDSAIWASNVSPAIRAAAAASVPWPKPSMAEARALFSHLFHDVCVTRLFLASQRLCCDSPVDDAVSHRFHFFTVTVVPLPALRRLRTHPLSSGSREARCPGPCRWSSRPSWQVLCPGCPAPHPRR